MSSDGRRKDIEAERERGRAIRDAGGPRPNPNHRDRYYFDTQGWDRRDHEITEAAAHNAERHVLMAIQNVENGGVRIALARLFEYVRTKQ